jgi:hypothetical protein
MAQVYAATHYEQGILVRCKIGAKLVERVILMDIDIKLY